MIPTTRYSTRQNSASRRIAGPQTTIELRTAQSRLTKALRPPRIGETASYGSPGAVPAIRERPTLATSPDAGPSIGCPCLCSQMSRPIAPGSAADVSRRRSTTVVIHIICSIFAGSSSGVHIISDGQYIHGSAVGVTKTARPREGQHILHTSGTVQHTRLTVCDIILTRVSTG